MIQQQIQQIIPYLGEIASNNGNEITPKYCPFCRGGQHHDKNTFSINSMTGAYNCLRGSCGEKGSIHRLAKYLGVGIMTKETYFRESKPKKIYKKPDCNSQELSSNTINYFKNRMISEKTLRDNRVVTDTNGNIVFRFYLNGELEFIKYKLARVPKQGETKSWREKDTRPILYGMDECVSGEALIIVEGEVDKLSLDEAEVKNAISIPSGTQDFSWVENCWEFLEQYHEIIIWADNDIAGKGFQQETIARLNDRRIRIVQSNFKDANEMLQQIAKEKGIDKAKEEIRKAIEDALPIKKEFITNLAHVKRRNYRNEIAISSGYTELDDLIGGFYGGQLIIWTGYNGSGKSTLLSNILLNGIEKGQRTFVYSGELSKEDFKSWSDLQLSGKKYLASYYCQVKRQEIPIPNPRYYEYLDNFYNEKIYLFDTDDYATDEKILSAMEYMAKREGIKIFAIDNMLTMNITGVGDLNEKQGKLILKLKQFARIYNAVVHLVAHPRKPAPGQSRVDKYSISGTANITDLADRVIGFHRLTSAERMKAEYSGFNNVMTIFKDRRFGVYDQEILFYFDYFDKRYYTNEAEKTREYSWVKSLTKQDKSHEMMSEVRGKDADGF